MEAEDDQLGTPDDRRSESREQCGAANGHHIMGFVVHF